MNQPLRLSLIPVIFVLVVSACASNAVEHQLTAANGNQTIESKVGDTLVVELEGNPTTGYTWEAVELDQAVLEQVGEPEYNAESDLLGAPGVIILRFKAVGPGQTLLKLVYHRPWEQDIPPEETFEVMIAVK
jgi:inhibitor of cysteine peptidase